MALNHWFLSIKSLNFILTTVLQIGFWPLMLDFGPPC